MESHPKLRRMALQGLRQPAAFWERFEAKLIPHEELSLPIPSARPSRKYCPTAQKPEYRILKTPKGLGSLVLSPLPGAGRIGRGRIAREAKAVVASANLWAKGKATTGEGNPWLERTFRSAVRCADPFYEVRGGWLVRRLGPDCSRIDMDELVHHEDMAELLLCMGQETANVHLGTPKGRKVVRRSPALVALTQKKSGAGRLPTRWLEKAAQLMLKLSLKDWHQFRDSKERVAVGMQASS